MFSALKLSQRHDRTRQYMRRRNKFFIVNFILRPKFIIFVVTFLGSSASTSPLPTRGFSSKFQETLYFVSKIHNKFHNSPKPKYLMMLLISDRCKCLPIFPKLPTKVGLFPRVKNDGFLSCCVVWSWCCSRCTR